MIRLVSGDLWKEIKKLAKKSQVKMAAIAYVTHDSLIRFGKGDLLIVDASDHAITSGQTSAPVLNKAWKRGASLYSHPDLHAKVILFDRVAVIGSANLSQTSMDSLVEAAVLTDHPNVVSVARSFLQQLQDESQCIDKGFIDHIGSLEVKRAGWGKPRRKKKRKTSISLASSRTWLVSLTEIDEGMHEDEREYIEKGMKNAQRFVSDSSSDVSWIRFTRSSKFRREAQRGDTVIQIWRERNQKIPTVVYRHAPLLWRQDEPNCTRFYVEEFADAEDTTMPWRRFLRLTQRVGLPGKVVPYTVRLLPEEYSEALSSLWDKE
jgi:phosphatidylserine/phosphatidylglycerophosphate/cardiolipin synthase-like enzyme